VAKSSEAESSHEIASAKKSKNRYKNVYPCKYFILLNKYKKKTVKFYETTKMN